MSPIEIFIRDCIADLRRIAKATNGDASLEDVKNEAWVMALNLAHKGDPLDLSSPDGQDSMIGKLFGRLVKPLRTRIGFALRIDKNWDQSDEDAGPRLSHMLAAPELSDPLKELEFREIPPLLEMACRGSYSQATAYAICLHRWKDAKSLAVYLCIKVETLNGRIRYWRGWVEYQPSLFDGIEHLGLDFTPLRGVPIAPSTEIYIEDAQRAWRF